MLVTLHLGCRKVGTYAMFIASAFATSGLYASEQSLGGPSNSKSMGPYACINSSCAKSGAVDQQRLMRLDHSLCEE
ncbi:hypothetical protein BDW69DRAFT_36911 [Aspergillus filifer]